MAHNFRRRLISATVALSGLLLLPSAHAEKLSIERIFSAPALTGAQPRAMRFAPDGQRISYLKGREDAPSRYDLWIYDIASNTHQRLVNSDVLHKGEEQLSDEEKARRERLRLSGSGIIDYSWSRDGKALLFPLNGDIYYYRIGADKARQLTQTDAFETDARLSPQGHYVSFIREQNLYIINLANGEETALTQQGGGPIKYGMAEFVAQEEMDRMTGYWWSPDESHIALTRVDESPVDNITRSEIYADRIEMIQQRYPKAGTANVDIDLGIMDIASKKTEWLNLAQYGDGYLARVKWLHDSQRLSYQWQNRSQQQLDLHVVNVNGENDKVLLTETSDTWINLNDDLYFLKDNKHFIWASERSGYKHLYLYRLDGSLIRQLTSGDWVVDELESVDEAAGLVYFTGRAKTPIERHLYRVHLNNSSAGAMTQISERDGMHDIVFASDSRAYLDTFSSPKQPPQTSLHGPTGERIAWLNQNVIDDQHPLKPYWRDWQYPDFGTLTAEDGQTLHYQITKPLNFDAQKKYPVMIYVYGGPGAQRVTRSWGNPFLQYMAQQGFVVFTLDNRGSTNRGKAFENPIYKNMGHPEVADQVRGVEYLRSLPYVDDQRIGIYGHSYGGYMALMTLFRAPDYFQAAVSGAPVTDWSLYDTHYTERYMGMPSDGKQYQTSAVFPYAKNLQGKLLTYHGMADDNVLFTNSTKLYKVLQDQALPFEMMTYPGKKHSIHGKQTRIHLYSMIADFFKRQLQQPSH
ncbi:S9 family peptidase [Idiomarina tyrosinivorans]|uniref:S9 family peptidase n=1 Tax=Idiomarina tyrosinivorans TaxID=1445662 RepID=A0A432ZP81_9GAMM|nr:alpha/beta fold hydrolase [Idiomarina tyrosinivorans]RUO79725.1 S9 family peptidase [Idiomarina tyrosinivorans]